MGNGHEEHKGLFVYSYLKKNKAMCLHVSFPTWRMLEGFFTYMFVYKQDIQIKAKGFELLLETDLEYTELCLHEERGKMLLLKSMLVVFTQTLHGSSVRNSLIDFTVICLFSGNSNSA